MRAVAKERRRAIVIANGAEGEPASLKDKLLLEALPHLVLDGGSLAVAAVGAGELIVCVPRSASIARDSLTRALRERERERYDSVAVRVESCRIATSRDRSRRLSTISIVAPAYPR